MYITRETLNKSLVDFNVGIALTNIISNVAGTAHTFYSTIDHGLAGITSVSIVSGGLGYGSLSGTAGNAYNARLVGFAGSTTGQNATAVITFNSSGTVTAVKIMDGGSAYGIGNTLAIVGVATTTGYSQAVVQVTHISNNIDDSIQLDGIELAPQDRSRSGSSANSFAQMPIWLSEGTHIVKGRHRYVTTPQTSYYMSCVINGIEFNLVQ